MLARFVAFLERVAARAAQGLVLRLQVKISKLEQHESLFGLVMFLLLELVQQEGRPLALVQELRDFV
jgi:hypothetical protein